MATSLGMIILLGLLANMLFNKLKMPGLLGMLLLGVLIGPYALNFISPDLLRVSEDLREIALIVILLRAGLGISRDDLHKVGNTALKLSCIPGLIEGFTIAIISTMLLGFSFIEGGILGFIIAAVSPAVVVPQMLEFLDKGVGTNKKIPTLILAGASLDDIFAITIVTTFLGLYAGSQINIGIEILNIPVSIILGIVLGFILGFILIKLFHRYPIKETQKVLIVLSCAIFLTAIEEVLQDKVKIAGLLGVMALGFILRQKRTDLAKELSIQLNKIWTLAEILLFVLVGAQVNIHVALDAGIQGLIIIAIGLMGRSLGVILSTLGTDFNWKERIFCVVAYTPKATVQAAIGAVPLSLGVESGEVILAIAVLSILITAPLGAIGIKTVGRRFLVIDKNNI